MLLLLSPLPPGSHLQSIALPRRQNRTPLPLRTAFNSPCGASRDSVHCERLYSRVICSASWMRSRNLSPKLLPRQTHLVVPVVVLGRFNRPIFWLLQFLPVSAAQILLRPTSFPHFLHISRQSQGIGWVLSCELEIIRCSAFHKPINPPL